ncbi:hypothetical protein L1887_28773 [Cichorium endivia]|nr:hypothetical protein L1887_28773 [Cichorium endivia]
MYGASRIARIYDVMVIYAYQSTIHPTMNFTERTEPHRSLGFELPASGSWFLLLPLPSEELKVYINGR